MPESDHLEILARGVAEWNQWRTQHAKITPNLIEARLANADLQGANLGGAYLIEAQLQGADLRGANLRGARLGRANLTQANLACADLIGANAIAATFELANLERAHLIATQLSGIMLAGANLARADLSYAYLTGANLAEANCQGANFTEADLIETRAIATDFSYATFTGACIQNWHLDCDTRLEHALCDYVYLQKFKQERCPQDPACRFPPEAFSQQFQKRRETLDFLFTNGIDWSAFLVSLGQLQTASDEIILQAIEQHADGSLTVRIRPPLDTDRQEVETAFGECYDREWKRLKTDDPELAAYRQQTANLTAIVQLHARHPRAIPAMPTESDKAIYRDAFLAIAVANAEPVVQFYRQLLDLDPCPHVPHVYAEFQLLGGLRLGIFQPKRDRWPEFADSRHSGTSLCLEVADLEGAIAHLTSLGYPPPSEITIASHGREIYAYDPAGNRIILHQSPRSNSQFPDVLEDSSG